MTFFDSKMFANGVLKQGQSSRSVGNRQSGGGGIIGAKFAATSLDAGSQFFNRTGPIKIPHKNKFQGMGSQPNTNTQNQSQHVEDMFNLADEVGLANETAPRTKKQNSFNNTQNIQAQNFMSAGSSSNKQSMLQRGNGSGPQ